jgi:hypothetical protein
LKFSARRPSIVFPLRSVTVTGINTIWELVRNVAGAADTVDELERRSISVRKAALVVVRDPSMVLRRLQADQGFPQLLARPRRRALTGARHSASSTPCAVAKTNFIEPVVRFFFEDELTYQRIQDLSLGYAGRTGRLLPGSPGCSRAPQLAFATTSQSALSRLWTGGKGPQRLGCERDRCKLEDPKICLQRC